MHLILLDDNNSVLSSTPVMFAQLHAPLTNRHVLSDAARNVGDVFDPTGRMFGPTGRKRWITKLAFDSRFTIPEAVALKAMQALPSRGEAETDADYIARTQVPAQLQVLQSRLNMASYVDLDRADTRQGVQQLEALGLLATGRALEILDGPIADHEYHPGA